MDFLTILKRKDINRLYEVESLWDLKDKSLGITSGNWGRGLGFFKSKDTLTVHIAAHGNVIHRWWDRGGRKDQTRTSELDVEGIQNVMKDL
jgi:hypothetical protein